LRWVLERVELAEGAEFMRSAIALFFLAGALSLASGPAQAVPLALGDHAELSREASGALVEQASGRAAYKRRGYAKRRYDWTYLPYWRPYQYRYWQFYYPHGGPLF
jgi:hypothetical protein